MHYLTERANPSDANIISSIENVNKVNFYNTANNEHLKYGLKFGTSKVTGTVKFNLDSTFGEIYKISILGYGWDDDEMTFSVLSNQYSFTTYIDDASQSSQVDIIFNNPITSFDISTLDTSKRIFVCGITLFTTSSN